MQQYHTGLVARETSRHIVFSDKILSSRYPVRSGEFKWRQGSSDEEIDSYDGPLYPSVATSWRSLRLNFWNSSDSIASQSIYQCGLFVMIL